MNKNILPKHLGGHLNKTHIDKNALSYLIKRFNIKKFCDIGCGPGGMVILAKELGLEAIGIDGDFTLSFPENLNIILHDFTTGPINIDYYDLAWSCEFLEHVKEEYQDNYFSAFLKCKVVCCTFSISSRGHHHVNVKDQQYWDNTFDKYGFIKDTQSTNDIRLCSSMTRDFIRTTGSVYTNRNI